MANTFKSTVTQAIGTSPTTVYETPAATTTTVIGLSVANILATSINVSATFTKGATTVYLIKDAPVPAGGALVIIGGEQKLVSETGNTLKVVSSIATSVDVVTSVLELT